MSALSLFPDDNDVAAVLLLAVRCCLLHIQELADLLLRDSVGILHIGLVVASRVALVLLAASCCVHHIATRCCLLHIEGFVGSAVAVGIVHIGLVAAFRVALLLLEARCCLLYFEVFAALLVRSSVEAAIAVGIVDIALVACHRVAFVVRLLKDLEIWAAIVNIFSETISKMIKCRSRCFWKSWTSSI